MLSASDGQTYRPINRRIPQIKRSDFRWNRITSHFLILMASTYLISTAPSNEFLPARARCHTIDIASLLTSIAFFSGFCFPHSLVYTRSCSNWEVGVCRARWVYLGRGFLVVYCIPNKSCSVFYNDSLYKNGQDLLDIQYVCREEGSSRGCLNTDRPE